MNIDFTNNWTNDSNELNIIKTKVTDYVNQFLESYQDLVLKILSYVNRITYTQFARVVNDYSKRLNDNFKLNDFCIVMAIKNDNKQHHSSLLSTLLKGVITISPSYDYEPDKSRDENNIIVLDDYSGSGKTFIDYVLPFFDSKYKNKRIIFAPVFITKTAKERLNEAFKEDKINNYELFCPQKINETNIIKDYGYFTDSEISKFEFLSKEYCKFSKDFYGYESVGDVFTTQFFTPNDDLKFLYTTNSKYYIPLFDRNRDFCIMDNHFYSNHFIHNIYSCADKDKKLVAIAILCSEGNNISAIAKLLCLKTPKVYKIINKLKNDKIIEDNNGYVLTDNFYKLINKDRYYRLINGYSIEEQVKMRLISAKNNK